MEMCTLRPKLFFTPKHDTQAHDSVLSKLEWKFIFNIRHPNTWHNFRSKRSERSNFVALLILECNSFVRKTYFFQQLFPRKKRVTFCKKTCRCSDSKFEKIIHTVLNICRYSLRFSDTVLCFGTLWWFLFLFITQLSIDHHTVWSGDVL